VLVEAEILGSTGRGRRRVDLEMLQDPPVVRTPEQKEGREGCCQLAVFCRWCAWKGGGKRSCHHAVHIVAVPDLRMQM
jgi:hypothetical protein